MDWNMVGAIGESVGAALFFISILYLALQVRTAKQMMAVEAAQRVRSEHHAVFAAMATSGVLAEALSEETAADPKQIHVRGWYAWCLSNWQNQFDLHRLGLVDQTIIEATVSAFRGFIEVRQSFRDFWREMRQGATLRLEFRDFLESHLSDEQRAMLLQGQEDGA